MVSATDFDSVYDSSTLSLPAMRFTRKRKSNRAMCRCPIGSRKWVKWSAGLCQPARKQNMRVCWNWQTGWSQKPMRKLVWDRSPLPVPFPNRIYRDENFRIWVISTNRYRNPKIFSKGVNYEHTDCLRGVAGGYD